MHADLDILGYLSVDLFIAEQQLKSGLCLTTEKT